MRLMHFIVGIWDSNLISSLKCNTYYGSINSQETKVINRILKHHRDLKYL